MMNMIPNNKLLLYYKMILCYSKSLPHLQYYQYQEHLMSQIKNQWKKSKTQRGALTSMHKYDSIEPTDTPFSSLWNSNSSVKEYSALADEHTTCYFGTGPARSRIKQLANDLTKIHFRGRSEVIKTIKSKRENIGLTIKKYEGIENVKVLPYTQGLRDNFQLNLLEFKNSLKINKSLKQQEHLQYLKQYCMNKKPEVAKIRMVHTLEPIGYRCIGISQNVSHYIASGSINKKKSKKGGQMVKKLRN